LSDQQVNSPTLAVVEDSEEILKLLSQGLVDAGYKVLTYTRADEFESGLAQHTPDLCIVDLNLPDKDGLNLVSKISSESDAAILVISGRSALQDKIVGLELGADDYLAKPFEIAEVVARVKALIRRKSNRVPPLQQNSIYRFSDWTLDLSQFLLTDRDGIDQKLSASEIGLLQFFLLRPNRLVTREQLREEINDDSDDLAFDRAIDVRVSRLRSKLKDSSKNPKIIKTIYGAGYIFISDVSSDEYR